MEGFWLKSPSWLSYDAAVVPPYPFSPIQRLPSVPISVTYRRTVECYFDMKEISSESLKVAAVKECSAPPAETSKALGTVEDDWVVDPRNPRNWPQGKKWAAVSVVSPSLEFVDPRPYWILTACTAFNNRFQSTP
jgi:hypothetical protein